MKYAIISDIHSNREALQACMEVMQEKGADRIICLGDIAGYGPDPNCCIDLMKSSAHSNIMGNHDQAIFDDNMKKRLNRWAHNAIAYQQQVISAGNKKWIKNLPYTDTPDELFSTTHSTFFDPQKFSYTSNENQAKSDIDSIGTSVGFFGHTHRGVIFKKQAKKKESRVEKIIPKEGFFYSLDDNYKYLINPGSIGQPRDGSSDASFVIFNTDSMGFRFYRISYDYTLTMKKIKAENLPAFLAERLALGK